MVKCAAFKHFRYECKSVRVTYFFSDDAASQQHDTRTCITTVVLQYMIERKGGHRVGWLPNIYCRKPCGCIVSPDDVIRSAQTYIYMLRPTTLNRALYATPHTTTAVHRVRYISLTYCIRYTVCLISDTLQRTPARSLWGTFLAGVLYSVPPACSRRCMPDPPLGHATPPAMVLDAPSPPSGLPPSSPRRPGCRTYCVFIVWKQGTAVVVCVFFTIC